MPLEIGEMIVDRTSLMQGKAYPRLDLHRADGSYICGIVGFDGIEPFDAALAPFGPAREQAGNYLRVPIAIRAIECGVGIPAGINVRATVEQPIGDIDPAHLGRDHERGAADVVGPLDLGSLVEQEVHHRDRADVRGKHQEGVMHSEFRLAIDVDRVVLVNDPSGHLHVTQKYCFAKSDPATGCNQQVQEPSVRFQLCKTSARLDLPAASP